MERIKQFWHFINVAEDVWSIVSLFLQLGVGGFMIAIFFKLQQLPSPWKELVFLLGIVALVVFCLSLTRLILAFRNKEKLTRLYENRDDLQPLVKDLERVEEFWVLWRVGTSAKLFRQAIWDNRKFKRLLIHHPKPKKGQPYYLEAHMLGFPRQTLKEACEDIYSATRQAPKHIEVKWFNGYLGDSLLIVNPHSKSRNGWIRIEIVTPCSQGMDRPSIRIDEKKYPQLFRNIINNYEHTFDDLAVRPPSEYRRVI